MPQFVAQILSLNGDVIFSNVDVSIDFSPQGLEWRGNFDLPPTSTFDPNSLPQRTIYKIQLNDGKRSRGKLIENQWVNFLGFAYRFY